jgi:molybdenum cofactor cytidylyltransferase
VSLAPNQVAAVILAAGESRRMGRAKALLPFRGGTFLSVLARTLGRHCAPVYAVFGFEAELLMPAAPAAVIAVHNADYAKGMLSSLQAGLRAIGPLPERILFTLVDHPAVLDSTLRELLLFDAPLVIPCYEGRRGHPVVMRRDIAEEIIAESPASKLNAVRDRHSDRIHYVDVDDVGVRDDIDEPHLYEALLVREAVSAADTEAEGGGS